MDKVHIIREIQRTAAANGGVPLGVERFEQETGIKISDWKSKIWIRWGDALRDAGFAPNQLNTAVAEEVFVKKFIELTRELGHVPVEAEVNYKAKHNDFPWWSTFQRRFGGKPQLATKILDYCKSRTGYEDIVTLFESIASNPFQQTHTPNGDHREAKRGADNSDSNISNTKEGYVYMALLKLGREKRYKIGKAILVDRRTDQIAIHLPEKLELVHSINTDDAYGIEAYWHKRFAEKNTNGEWFDLTLDDVRAFKRRKIM